MRSIIIAGWKQKTTEKEQFWKFKMDQIWLYPKGNKPQKQYKIYLGSLGRLKEN